MSSQLSAVRQFMVARGKSARVVADLQQLMILVKGLPLAYNRDLQVDKEALFEAERRRATGAADAPGGATDAAGGATDAAGGAT